ncbi:MAG: agmatine deiminase family protein [Planctomycetota bacterium]
MSAMKRRTLMQAAAMGAIGGGWGLESRAQGDRGGDALSAKDQGYRMPLESGGHTRTFMQWPTNSRVYGGARWLREAQAAIARIANAIVPFEPVVMLAPVKERERLRKHLSREVEHWGIPTDDLWCRDSGPTFVRSAEGKLAVSELNFNGWGGKQVFRHDGAIAARVAERMALPLIDSGLVGEGGGVETDGAGTLLAHESSWVIENRNPGMSRDEVERRLCGAFGAEKVIWARGLKDRDITDYHIDSLARWVEPGRVLIERPDEIDADDPWGRAARETEAVLRAAVDSRGQKLEVVTVTPPQDVRSTSRDFVGSYANYYVCNGAVIASEFGDKDRDAAAQKTLSTLYPGREIVMLNTDPIAEAGGGIHCATQQQPAAG